MLQIITEYENNLRALILFLIGESDGSPYQVSPDRIKIWKEKREIEEKKYKGLLIEKRLLYFSDFYDLKQIVIKNWDKFLPILHEKKRFEIFFSEVEKYRNTLAHGREITIGQENLLKGITSDLKNLISIYHNKNEMKDDYFIRITRVSDNMGNVWQQGSKPRPTLRVDDEYELIVEAVDPKDRDIQYSISTNKDFSITKQVSNRFQFKIPLSLVGQNISFVLRAFTPESEYKNEIAEVIRMTILPK